MPLNQLKFDQLETGSVFPITASYAISSSAGSGGTSLTTGSTYPITSSWSNNSITASYYGGSVTSASYSSTSSNLSPVAQDLIPFTSSTYSLGSPTNKWKDLYVSTGSIYIGETVLSTSGSTLYTNTSPVVTLNTASGQIQVAGITASLSASFATNTGLLNNTSSTVFATTGSNNFNGNQTVQGNVTVIGSLIAQQYVVSSSVSYFTSSNFDGSTKFGDTDSDTHQFTGSLRSPNITGSLLGTSSYSSLSLTASYFGGSVTSASYALTASYSLNGGGNVVITSSLQTGSIANQTILYNFSSSQESTLTGLNLSNNKWGVSVVEEWDTNIVPGDQYYSSCSLILHFNGVNGATTFVDNSPNVFGISGSNGVAISTVQSKFGGSSVKFDGTNDYITIATGQKGNLSSGDFTIEFWLYTTSATGTFSFIQQGEYDWRFAGGNTSVDIVFDGVTRISGATFSANTWNHLALVKNGSTTTLYINGTSAGTTTASPANSANNIYLGVNAAGIGNVWYYNGYMDEVRITKGYARYTGSFTPPSAEFYNNVSVTQLQTKYIGSVGGLNDTNVDYGILKLSDSSLKIRKMSDPGVPVSGSVALSSSVDRVYVNVLNYDNVSVSGSITNSTTASYALTASYSLNGGGTTLTTGSTYLITSSWSNNSVSSSYSLTASFASNAGSSLTTGSTYPITSSWATTSSNIIGGTSNYIPLWSTNTSLGNSVLYQNSSNIGIGTTSPAAILQVVGTGVGSIGTINIKGSQAHIGLTSAAGTFKGWYGYFNSITHGSDNDLNIKTGYAGTSNIRFSANGDTTEAMLYIKSDGNVGIGTTSPNSKLEVVGNISASAFTGSHFGTSSWANTANSATSASYSLSSSYSVNSSIATSSSFASTASYNLNSISSSFAATSSYNLNSVSSSYALTASFSLNSGGGGTTLTTGSTYPITSSWSNNATTASYALNASGGGGSISYITGSPVIGQYIVVSGSGTTQYTLTQSVTNPAHLLVSVNGVVQNYSSSYTVTGSTLNFYQPYSDGDEIDVRFLNGNTTLQTGSIAGQTILYNFSSSQESTLTGLNLTGNKWGITVVEEWNSGSGDIYFNSCSLLCHFDSLNPTGIFIDNSSNNFSITSSGNVNVNVGVYKFSGGSAYFGGSSGDYLQISNNTKLNLSSVSWTVECWVRPIGDYSTYRVIFGKRVSGGGNASYQGFLNITTGIISFYNGTTYNSSTTLTANQWSHCAYVYDGTNLKIYVNGTQVLSNALSITEVNEPVTIGGLRGINESFYGYIDEFRITKGVARYSGSFTPPSDPFPNSSTQTATKYIGLVGGLNDTNVDYGIEKLSDSSLKIKKLTDTQQPSSSFLSSSVDRVYVNVLNYDNVSISNAVTSSYAVTASYALNSTGGSTGDVISPFLLAGM